MRFKTGDSVVHPVHGVGNIVKIEERRLAEEKKRLYYVLKANKSTIWVPVNAHGSPPLRRLTPKRDLKRYRTLLKSQPNRLNKDHRKRRLEVSERVEKGSFRALCEAVRDLTACGWRRSLSDADGELLKRINAQLAREWAAAGDMTVSEAAQEIKTLLREARQKHQPAVKKAS
jgi:CarD family transcriptional regulator